MRLFLFATVLFSLVFSVADVEGARRSGERPWKIKRVLFTGNTTFRRLDLINKMALRPVFLKKRPRFTKSRLKSDIKTLTRFYQSQGFLNATASASSVVRDSLRKKVSIVIAIDEGPRTMVEGISFARFVVDSTIMTKMKCREGKPLVQPFIQHDERFLKDGRANKGFLFASVNCTQSVDSTTHKAYLHFTVKDGPLVTVDRVSISGTKKLQQRILTRELTFKKGDTLTLAEVRKSEQRLYRTNLLNSVEIEPVVKDSTDTLVATGLKSFPIGISLREANFFRLKLGVGYGTQEKLRSSIETSYNNLFRSGHRLTFKGNVSFVMQHAQAIYSTPWFLGIPLRFDGSVYYNRFSDETLYRGLFRGALLSLERSTDFSATYQLWTKIEDVLWIKAEGLPNDYPTKNTQSLGTDILYDTRNNLLNPSKGIYSLLKMELAGITGSNSNQFIKISNDFRFYWNAGNIRFASGVKLGWVRPYGKSAIVPLQDQFYAGGSRSVRGFKDNLLRSAVSDSGRYAVSGNILGTANLLEVRFPIVWWIKGAVFADAGYVWERLDNASVRSVLQDIRWTAGPGLRINSPIAIIRFDVGFKLDKKPKELLAQWHLDVGQSF